MKITLFTAILALLAALAGCEQRAPEVTAPDAAASAPDVDPLGAGGGGRR